jgi:hypothetical protein
MMYRRDDRIAVISKPVYYLSTRYYGYEEIDRPGREPLIRQWARGIKVRMFHVQIAGQVVFSAPTQDLCRDWLVRQGYFPTK